MIEEQLWLLLGAKPVEPKLKIGELCMSVQDDSTSAAIQFPQFGTIRKNQDAWKDFHFGDTINSQFSPAKQLQPYNRHQNQDQVYEKEKVVFEFHLKAFECYAFRDVIFGAFQTDASRFYTIVSHSYTFGELPR